MAWIVAAAGTTQGYLWREASWAVVKHLEPHSLLQKPDIVRRIEAASACAPV
ncbi:MAG: hypothetical protein ACJ8AH_10440 [Stellaceae bacterium]